jgi:hypothetical protein
MQEKSKLHPKNPAFILFSKRMFSFHRSASLFQPVSNQVYEIKK